jgi:acylphosphatase
MEEPISVESRVHAWIGGQVQGVGFRMFVQEQAVNLRVNGWVRNRWDGRVEVLAEGKREVLERLLGILRRGPRSSTVSDFTFEWQSATGEFRNFIIRRTE